MANFKAEEKDGALIIKCPPTIDLNPDLDLAAKMWQEKPYVAYIIDFAGVIEFKERAYRPFILFNQFLKPNGKRLYSINVSTQLNSQLQQGGLLSTFTPVKNIAEAVAKAKPAGGKATLNVEFINPFITATQNVLSTQCNITLNCGKPYTKKPDEQLPMEIAGVISLGTPAFTGSISLCMRSEVFLKLYENMVGEKHASITPELEDAAGELLNMIFGQAKTILNDEKGHTLEKALPTIMRGEKLSLRHHGQAPVIILPFESSAGSFHIEVLVEKV
jgi:chemotaxis protein CheX